MTIASGWPPENLDAECRFGHPAARLYPLLGRTVHTGEGKHGILIAAAAHGATIATEGGAVTVPLEGVLPPTVHRHREH